MRLLSKEALVLFGVLFAISLRQVADYDVFFHMVVGREVVRQMTLPAEEFYVLLMQGQPAEFYEWGFGVVYYLVHQAAGPVGMSLFNSLMAAAALTLVIAAGLRRESRWWVAFIVAAPLLWWMYFRLVFRPEMLLFLFVAIEIFLMERFLRAPDFRLLAPMPALAWFLAQCHPSSLILMAVFGAYGLQAVIQAGPAERMRQAVSVGATGLLMALVALLNPYGINQILLPFSFAADRELLENVVEFQPSLQSPLRWTFIAVAAAMLAALAAPSRRVVDILLVLVFGILALNYVRNLALFTLVGAVPLTRGIDWLTSRLDRRMSIAVALAAAAVMFTLPIKHGPWGIGIHQQTFPDVSVDFLARHHPEGNILNFFRLGSYLRWRLDETYPIFVDGRNYSFNVAMRAHRRVFAATPGWRDEISGLNISVVVTPATIRHSGELIPLVAELADDPAWDLVAVEPAALTFLRADMLTDLPRRNKQEVWRHAIEGATWALSNNPYADSAQQTIDLARRKLAAE